MKHVGCILGIFFISAVFFGIVLLEIILLDSNPPQVPDDITIEEWLASFRMSALTCIGAALVASLLWYGLAQWIFKINNPEDAGKRMIWGLLFLLPIGAVISGIFSTARAESGLVLVYLFFLIDSVLCYWIATILFSPSSFKFTPIGAVVFRRW